MGSNIKNILILMGILIFIFLSACTKKTLDDGESDMPKYSIEEVLKKHSVRLMAIPRVVGVGQGLCDGKDCIKVFVEAKSQELERRISTEIDGYTVDLVESGEIKPLKKN